jgi:hypothetical protein
VVRRQPDVVGGAAPGNHLAADQSAAATGRIARDRERGARPGAVGSRRDALGPGAALPGAAPVGATFPAGVGATGAAGAAAGADAGAAAGGAAPGAGAAGGDATRAALGPAGACGAPDGTAASGSIGGAPETPMDLW